MKKKNLKSLKLNKKSVSNFQIIGGRPPLMTDEAPSCTCGSWVSGDLFTCEH